MHVGRDRDAAVVAVAAPVVAPARPYSGLVIGGLWPVDDPQIWVQSASTLRRTAHELLSYAEGIRHRAEGVLAEGQSGQAIGGFVEACYRKHAATATAIATHSTNITG